MFKRFQLACCSSPEKEIKSTEVSAAADARSQSEQPENVTTMTINSDIATTWKPAEDHKIIPFAKYDQQRRFHAVKDSPYVLPADMNEQDRLVLQHKLVTYGFGRLFHMPIEKQLEAGGFKILDSGCGPGAWGKQVVKNYPNAIIVGLDMSKTVLNDTEGAGNITFVEGNLLAKLPFEDNTFDAVYQRLLILGIPKDKWVDVIKELKRVTKPGGYIELVESCCRSFRTGPNYSKLLDPFYDSLAARGLDVEAGLNIRKYMEEAGIEVIQEAVHSAPIGWGGRFGELMALNLDNIWASIKPFMSKVLSLSDEEYDGIAKKAQQECPEYQTYGNFYAVVGKVSK